MAACPNCGEDNPDRARFCWSCGAALVPGEAGAERKVVTVLFADVAGSTPLGERLDPERLEDVMSAYFEAMRQEIQAQGGTVEKFIGDAVMAAFGVPRAHEDDPARALRAALGMLERLRTLNDDLAGRYGVTLEVRIGVNTGEVLAAASPGPGERMVTGDAVNVAARLEQAASPGQVLVADRTARATRGFRFENAGSLELKGKGQAVPAVALAGIVTTKPERGLPGIRAPLVGRDRELDLLGTLYERVAEEALPHLATVYGEAGVGKSRLTAEFLDSLASSSDGPLVVRGRCLPYGEGVTYWPFAEVLKGVAGVLDSDPPETARQKIRAAVRPVLTEDLTGDPAKSTAALAFTVGLEDPEFVFRTMAPRHVRMQTHAAWRAFFSGLAAGQPVVVVVEDIHWADPALLDLLEELADRGQGRVLFVCPARPELTERRPTWGGGRRNFSSISLEPLSRQDSDRLVEYLLAVEELPAPVHEAILQRAEGNPFFLEEIIRHLIDEGRIVRAGDRWRAAAEIDEVVIPDTVQGVLAARIDLLAPEEKRALQSAAVVGRVFWTGPVGKLLDGQAEQLDDILDRLEGRELVLSRLGSSMTGDREYIFKHILTRDVAYESLPRRDRATAHARVAGWIEETAGERRREFAELLAHHYAEAHRGARDDPHVSPGAVDRLRTKAFEHLLLASEEAGSKLVVGKAQRFADEALGVAGSDVERGRALESLGDACIADYQGTAAYRAYREGVTTLAAAPEEGSRIARLCGKAAEVAMRWAGTMSPRATPEEVMSLVEMGLSHVGGEDSEELVRLLMAKSLWPFGFARPEEEQHEAIEAGERAVAIAMRMDRPDLAAGALDALAGAYLGGGRSADAMEVTDRRVTLVPRLQDPYEIGDTFAMSAWHRCQIGLYREAVRYADEGLRRAAEGPDVAILHCLNWRVASLGRLGRWEEALADVATAERLLGDRMQDPPRFVNALFAWAGLIHHFRGDEAAAERYRVVMDLMRGEARAGPAWIALITARGGGFLEALEWLDEEATAGSMTARSVVLETLCAVVAEGQAWDEAEGVVLRARQWSERGGFVALPLFAERLEGQAALARGDVDGAIEALGRASDGFSDLGARWEAACTDLALAEALRRAGHPEQASEIVKRALLVFDDLGSVRESARARSLLAEPL